MLLLLLFLLLQLLLLREREGNLPVRVGVTSYCSLCCLRDALVILYNVWQHTAPTPESAAWDTGPALLHQGPIQCIIMCVCVCVCA